jgi:hypothetical protein
MAVEVSADLPLALLPSDSGLTATPSVETFAAVGVPGAVVGGAEVVKVEVKGEGEEAKGEMEKLGRVGEEQREARAAVASLQRELQVAQAQVASLMVAGGEAQYQAIHLVAMLTKIVPGWLRAHGTVIEVLRARWMSPARQQCLANEENLTTAQLLESKRLVKCFLTLVREDHSQVRTFLAFASLPFAFASLPFAFFSLPFFVRFRSASLLVMVVFEMLYIAFVCSLFLALHSLLLSLRSLSLHSLLLLLRSHSLHSLWLSLLSLSLLSLSLLSLPLHSLSLHSLLRPLGDGGV